MKKYNLLALAILLCSIAHAQLSPLSASFFQNQYLVNPALAGTTEEIRLNSGYNKQWSTVPGAPVTQYLTLDKGFERVGVGMNIYADKAGLLKRTRVIGTYAYHLPIDNNGDIIHFGISMGILSQRISNEDINGVSGDVSIAQFNDRNAVFDGDFGMAYTSEKLNIQGAVPNLKNFLKRELYNSANWNTFYSAASYKFIVKYKQISTLIEPKVILRGVRNSKNVLDMGVNISAFQNKVFTTVMYHTTQNITLGAGVNYKDFSILGMYTSRTYALKGYVTGNFEIGLGYNFKMR